MTPLMLRVETMVLLPSGNVFYVGVLPEIGYCSLASPLSATSTSATFASWFAVNGNGFTVLTGYCTNEVF